MQGRLVSSHLRKAESDSIQYVSGGGLSLFNRISSTKTIDTIVAPLFVDPEQFEMPRSHLRSKLFLGGVKLSGDIRKTRLMIYNW